MEKTLSPDEKIKRAEEIYYRRKQQDINRKSAKVNVSSKKDFGMLKRMILQIVICIVIYSGIYIIQNRNYIFSENLVRKLNEILSYDIDIKNLYKQGIEYLNSFFDNIKEKNLPTEENLLNDNVEETDEEKINQDIETENILENIGGENIETIEETEEVNTLSQMEQDAKDIIESKSLIIPLKGTITSRFGLRDPETPTVPKNHTGIDIAVNEGTIFIAAMDGIVEEVSSEGDLGNHFKIVNGDVATVYAHCKEIYVKKGDSVKQGQNIGEVGSTGNSTGPHLHFEIRKSDRYVDPDLILEF